MCIGQSKILIIATPLHHWREFDEIIRMVGLMLSYAQRQEFSVTCSIQNLRPWFQGAQWGVVFIHIMTLLGCHLLAKIGWQENVSNVSSFTDCANSAQTYNVTRQHCAHGGNIAMKQSELFPSVDTMDCIVIKSCMIPFVCVAEISCIWNLLQVPKYVKGLRKDFNVGKICRLVT